MKHLHTSGCADCRNPRAIEFKEHCACCGQVGKRATGIHLSPEEARQVVEALTEIHDSLQNTHDAVCVPVWTNYDRHAPNADCELLETCDAALAVMRSKMPEGT